MNLKPADLEAAALPIELEVYLIWWAIKVTILAGPFGHGGYSPGSLLRSLITRWWKRRVLNPIPKFAKLRCYPVNTPPPFVTVILHHTVTALVACLFLWLKATKNTSGRRLESLVRIELDIYSLKGSYPNL